MPRKVKGFTLIELLIVMATFSVIMFGALQLMDPVSKIMTSTANHESVSATADNIKRYMEMNLRYAEYVAVNSNEPTSAQMFDFINSHYDGKLVKTNSTNPADPVVKYASGTLYILKIDNKNGGKISRKAYPFTVGDTKNSTANTSLYTSAAGGYVEEDWAVNKALYNEYHFNISLGLFDIDHTSGQLVPVSTDLVSEKNLSFTITAYPYDAAKGVNRQPVTPAAEGTDPVAPFVYDPGYVYSASMSLMNIVGKEDKTYLSYNWEGDPTTGYTIKKTDEGKDTFKNVKPSDRAPFFSFSPTTLSSGVAEPDTIYIMYTYSGEEFK